MPPPTPDFNLSNILIFLISFLRRGSQQAVVKEYKRGVARYCIYPDPASQMAMCSFTHSFIHCFNIVRMPYLSAAQ